MVSRFADTSRVTIWARGGRTSEEGVSFLENKISQKNPILNESAIVLFWHATCDMTKLIRPKRYVQQSFSTASQAIEFLTPSFDRLLDIARKSNFHLGILEIPPMFPSVWNGANGHPTSIDVDSIVNNQVSEVNAHIREINNELNYRSPKFSLDCMKFRGRPHRPHGSYFSSDLFANGIHPLPVACQKWLYQIMLSVSRAITW